jgi:hypothetical protein
VAVAALEGASLAVHLLPLLHEDRLAPLPRGAVLAAFGAYGAEPLEAHRRRHPDVQQVGQALDAVRRYRVLDLRRVSVLGNVPIAGRRNLQAPALLDLNCG